MNDRDLNDDSNGRDEKLVRHLIQTAGRGPTASPEARTRIYAAVHDEWQRQVEGRRVPPTPRRPVWLAVWNHPGLAVAATILLAIVIGAVLRAPDNTALVEVATVTKAIGAVDAYSATGLRTSPGPRPDAAVLEGQSLVTGPGGGIALAYPGGLSLRVSSDSEVRFVSADAIELIRGALYLDTGVAPGPRPALRVDTPFGSVRHTGTQYELRVAGANLRIRVREGAIRLTDENRELDGVAGEELLVTSAGVPRRGAISAADPEWQWVEALAALPEADNQPLPELLQWAARQTGRELVYESAAVEAAARDLTLHSAAGLTPRETLEVIEETTGLGYRLAEDSLLVY
jgi:hypothetical protein